MNIKGKTGFIALLIGILFLLAGCDAVLEAFYPDFAKDGDASKSEQIVAKVILKLDGNTLRYDNFSTNNIKIAAVPYRKSDMGIYVANWGMKEVFTFDRAEGHSNFRYTDELGDHYELEFKLWRDEAQYMIVAWQETAEKDEKIQNTEPAIILKAMIIENGVTKGVEKFSVDYGAPNTVDVTGKLTYFSKIDEGKLAELYGSSSGGDEYLYNFEVNPGSGTWEIPADAVYNAGFDISRSGGFNVKPVNALKWWVTKADNTSNINIDGTHVHTEQIWDSMALNFWINVNFPSATQWDGTLVDFHTIAKLRLYVEIQYADGQVRSQSKDVIFKFENTSGEALNGSWYTLDVYMENFPVGATVWISAYDPMSVNYFVNQPGTVGTDSVFWSDYGPFQYHVPGQPEQRDYVEIWVDADNNGSYSDPYDYYSGKLDIWLAAGADRAYIYLNAYGY